MLSWQLRKFKSSNDPLLRCQAALSIGKALAASLAKSSTIRGTQVEAINALIESIRDDNEAVRVATHKVLEDLVVAIPVDRGCEDTAASKRKSLGTIKFFLKIYVEAIRQSGGKKGVDMRINESLLGYLP